MSSIFDQIKSYRIVPVIVIDDPAKAAPLGKALIDGGLPCAEITFRTANAAAAIKEMAKAHPNMFIGAGTVLTCGQADAAIEAGAKFIIAPGLNPDVVRHCQKKGIPVLPGVMTPSEIEWALSLGLDTVKFFPAEAAGGINMIKSLSAPYRKIKFVPTGGVSPKNLKDYLAVSSVIACGGSWMVTNDLIAGGNFEEITRLTREAVEIVK